MRKVHRLKEDVTLIRYLLLNSLLISLMCLFLGSGCAARKKCSECKLITSCFTDTERPKYPRMLSDEVKARLVDIPLPTEVSIYELSPEESSSQVLILKMPMTIDETAAWFDSELIQWGWQLKMLCRSSLSSYIFAKPRRICNIILEEIDVSSEQVVTLVRLFINQKVQLLK